MQELSTPPGIDVANDEVHLQLDASTCPAWREKANGRLPRSQRPMAWNSYSFLDAASRIEAMNMLMKQAVGLCLDVRAALQIPLNTTELGGDITPEERAVRDAETALGTARLHDYSVRWAEVFALAEKCADRLWS
jgi:hypothetical protein